LNFWLAKPSFAAKPSPWWSASSLLSVSVRMYHTDSPLSMWPSYSRKLAVPSSSCTRAERMNWYGPMSSGRTCDGDGLLYTIGMSARIDSGAARPSSSGPARFTCAFSAGSPGR
jgi:hypothetical protein